MKSLAGPAHDGSNRDAPRTGGAPRSRVPKNGVATNGVPANGVTKNAVPRIVAPKIAVPDITVTNIAVTGVPPAGVAGGDSRTRARVKALLLEHGGATAAELGEAIGLSPAAIRKHLDAMLADGDVIARDQHVHGQRSRGRPAKVFALTDAGRMSCGSHTYDDLANSALRWIWNHGGDTAVTAFATDLVGGLEDRCRTAIAEVGDEPLPRAEALARALSAEGYAASATAIASGGQLCQHHCPVAQVAAEFPQLCEAETQVISRLVGTHVQRLATIANGDGVCTTYIPDPRRAVRAKTTETRKTIEISENTERVRP